MTAFRRAQTDLWYASQAIAANRRGDITAEGDENGEPGELTVDAQVGALLEAQVARATIDIANALNGLKSA